MEIEWEDPPPIKKNNDARLFVEKLKEFPKRWGVYGREFKTDNTRFMMKQYPDTEWVAAPRPREKSKSGKQLYMYTYYARWVGVEESNNKGGIMPYHVDQNNPGCPPDKPFSVVKDSDGKVMGCHATKEQANSQLAALYANEPDSNKEK